MELHEYMSRVLADQSPTVSRFAAKRGWRLSDGSLDRDKVAAFLDGNAAISGGQERVLRFALGVASTELWAADDQEWAAVSAALRAGAEYAAMRAGMSPVPLPS